MTKLKEVSQRFIDKENEIAAVYAKATGRDIDRLSESERSTLEEEVTDLIDEAEDALLEGDTFDEWKAQDERLAATPIGQLILERHEIEEEMLDVLEGIDDIDEINED